MRIQQPPDLTLFGKPLNNSGSRSGTFSHLRGSTKGAHFAHTAVLLMPSRTIKLSQQTVLRNCCAVEAHLRFSNGDHRAQRSLTR